MNIFYLDKNPKIAAEMHCDKHVVKMITETAQLLSTAHRILDGKACVVSKMSYSKKNKTYTVKENYKHYHLEGDFYNDDGILVPDKCPIYLAAYKNHPSAVWARLARGNYNWLSDLPGDYLFRHWSTRTPFHRKSPGQLELPESRVQKQVIDRVISNLTGPLLYQPPSSLLLV